MVPSDAPLEKANQYMVESMARNSDLVSIVCSRKVSMRSIMTPRILIVWFRVVLES